MRKNILEILKETTFDYAQEAEKIDHLFCSNTLGLKSSLQHYADIEIKNWKHRGTIISSKEMREVLNLPIPNEFRAYLSIDENNILDFFEFILNMINIAKNGVLSCPYAEVRREIMKNFDTILENIKHVLEKTGYEMRLEDDFVSVIKKSEEAIAVAELYEDIANDVMEYQRHSITLKRKRELLSALFNRYEQIEQNLKANCQSELCNDIGTILNNLKIRHGKTSNDEFVEKMTKEELEEWYDKCYDCLLLAFMTNKYLEYKKDIKNLRCMLKSK